MNGLYLHRSNRLEALAEALASIVRSSPLPPLETETVVVQSRGMGAWVQQQLAAATGVSMVQEFPFPAAHAQSLFRAALGPQVSGQSAFERRRLEWRVAALLPEIIGRPGAEGLARYLAQKPHPLKRFQVAQRIAASFDRYVAHRPATLHEWEAGRGTGWQAELWRLLTQGTPEGSPLSLQRKFEAAIAADPRALASLPQRVSVFGVSALPQHYLHLLEAAARVLEVHLFALTPTPEFWADLLTRKEADRLARKADVASFETLHAELGHPLLSSWGKAGRTFCAALLDLHPKAEAELFFPPEGATILGRIQADIYSALPPQPPAAEPVRDAPFLPEPQRDDSLRVHCCHSPLRELEVLQNQLLYWLQTDHTLQPRDILVTMPEVADYAPLIEAVFGVVDDSCRIPFTIADRCRGEVNPSSRAFLALIEFASGRCTAPETLALFEYVPIRQSFGVSEEGIALLREWIESAGIRWGIDAEHRAGLGLPADGDATWRAGLERLLLSLALDPGDETPFGGVLPAPGPDAATAELLGRLAHFCEQLFTQLQPLAATEAVWSDWRARLLGVAKLFLGNSAQREDYVDLTTQLDGVGALETDYAEPVPWQMVQAHLKALFREEGGGGRFLGGKMTFCTLKPLRSIPFKVVAVLGLNQTAFPRREDVPAFDLRHTEPVQTERTRRAEDCELFLETVLSAREKLHLSYCGVSSHNAFKHPPSVVVSELLECVARTFLPRASSKERTEFESALTVQHPLQAFSERYFNGSNPLLFSFSEENCAAAVHRRQIAPPPPFCSGTLPAGPPAPATLPPRVQIAELVRFFANPAAYFLRSALQIQLDRTENPLADTEPFSHTALEMHKLRQFLCAAQIAGESLHASTAKARARGLLAPGAVAQLQLAKLWSESAPVAQRVTQMVQDPLDPLRVHLELPNGWRLEGLLTGRYGEGGIVAWRAGEARCEQWMDLWIRQLALAAGGAGVPAAVLVHRVAEKPVTHAVSAPASPEEALDILGRLVSIFERGQREPLRFFPKSSLAFAEALTKGEEAAMKAAESNWEGNERSPGDSENEAISLCFGSDPEPLNATFKQLSAEVLCPLMSALTVL
jgi:exodeoxyribonuclease V gamma subunit